MNKNVWKVVTQYANQEAIMNHLSASDSSAFACAFGIPVGPTMRIKYFNPLRDMPELLDWFMQMYRYGHKITLVGRDVPRLMCRILHPDKYDYSDKSPIWLWPMVVSTHNAKDQELRFAHICGMESYPDENPFRCNSSHTQMLTYNHFSGLVFPHMHINKTEHVDGGMNWSKCLLRNTNGINVVFADRYYVDDYFSSRMDLTMYFDEIGCDDVIVKTNEINWYNAHSMEIGATPTSSGTTRAAASSEFGITMFFGYCGAREYQCFIPLPT
jgi:hypothetical protein